MSSGPANKKQIASYSDLIERRFATFRGEYSLDDILEMRDDSTFQSHFNAWWLKTYPDDEQQVKSREFKLASDSFRLFILPDVLSKAEHKRYCPKHGNIEEEGLYVQREHDELLLELDWTEALVCKAFRLRRPKPLHMYPKLNPRQMWEEGRKRERASKILGFDLRAEMKEEEVKDALRKLRKTRTLRQTGHFPWEKEELHVVGR